MVLSTDEAGEVLQRMEHYPYGHPRAQSAHLPSRTYTGQERDGTTGLSYHSARYLDTRLGRWTATDPEFNLVRQGLTIIQELQAGAPYAYSQNSPLVYHDPSGRALVVSGVLARLPDVTTGDPNIAPEEYALTRSSFDVSVAANGDLQIELQSTQVFYRSGQDRGRIDPQGRTLQRHEQTHREVAESFYTQDRISAALAAVGAPTDLSRLSRAQQTRVARAVESYLTQYEKYLQQTIVHGRTGLEPPTYRDPIRRGGAEGGQPRERSPSAAALRRMERDVRSSMPLEERPIQSPP